jgi:hypothetical protein
MTDNDEAEDRCEADPHAFLRVGIMTDDQVLVESSIPFGAEVGLAAVGDAIAARPLIGYQDGSWVVFAEDLSGARVVDRHGTLVDSHSSEALDLFTVFAGATPCLLLSLVKEGKIRFARFTLLFRWEAAPSRFALRVLVQSHDGDDRF